MNKILRSLSIATLCLPNIAFSAGLHHPGYVYVSPNDSIWGTMNVRHNTTAPGTPYIGAALSAWDGVVQAAIYGYGSEGEYFHCTFFPANQSIIDMVSSLSNGSSLYATKDPDSDSCTFLQTGKHSMYLD